ncbi:Non-canonical non-ribosomal peptide synthetase FUB8 [Pseudocercospora fuligena]|uniref:Non-canonical non-ribosomal peptide synthetase FUB8 n=1 Tax=Pseudocercospora fuligena TaxID=685502 RepID=A0A8H6R5W1_9PEZI|nr:Non-canonical non-ribosomal peptide synthetase FUB8 [Pseudocercospora fuligena]
MDLAPLSQHHTRLELLPTALDQKAEAHPEKIWASIPIDSNDLSKGFQEIKWRTAADAYNRAAWSFDNTIKPAPECTFPTIAYIGPPDLRYFFLTVALVKLGYKVLLMQPSVSIEGQLNLLDKTDCQKIIYGDLITKPLEAILAARKQIQAFQSPSLQELMSKDDSIPTYPFNHTPESYLNNPLMIIHTSGSTGLPKPVVLSFGFLAVNILNLDLPYLDNQPNNWQCIRDCKRFYIGFPIAHAGGIHVGLIASAYNDVTIVMVQGFALSGEIFSDVIKYGGARGALTMPRVLIEVAKSESAMQEIRKMDFVLWAGGHIPKSVGDSISKLTRLASSWGTTESGSHVLHLNRPEDWEYNHFSPTYNHLRFTSADDAGTLFEVSAVKNPDVRLRHYQKIFWAFPDQEEWWFGDLWSRHPDPSKKNLWRYEGRKDDMIILDSGHNFHPAFYLREILLKDPRVANAVILGTGKPSLAVILEVRDGESRNAGRYLDLARKVNERSTTMAQIPEENVIVASHEKILPKGAKGDVVPKLAEKLYEEELSKIWG